MQLGYLGQVNAVAFKVEPSRLVAEVVRCGPLHRTIQGLQVNVVQLCLMVCECQLRSQRFDGSSVHLRRLQRCLTLPMRILLGAGRLERQIQGSAHGVIDADKVL